MDLITTLTPYPPCQIQTESHKAAQKRIYKSKAWREAKAKFLRAHPVCCYCGKPAIIPHHPTRTDYGTLAYMGEIMTCEPVCRGCHSGIHHGWHLCYKCGKHWTKYDICYFCDPEARVELINSKVRQSEDLKAALKQEVRLLLHENRNGMYVRITEMVSDVKDMPEKYPNLAKSTEFGRRLKIANGLRDLGCEKNSRHGTMWVIRRLNL